jgi:hypothetical protein
MPIEWLSRQLLQQYSHGFQPEGEKQQAREEEQ